MVPYANVGRPGASAQREENYSAGEPTCEAAIMPPFGGTGETLTLTPSPIARQFVMGTGPGLLPYNPPVFMR